MTTSRIAHAFSMIRHQSRPGVIPFLTAGFPSVSATLELVPALEQAGADLIELGVPFSDPLADGPIIQKASFHAIQQGVTLERCIQLCAELRQRGVSIPLILMGYYNPLLNYGLPRFARDASQAGVDGVIAADLPVEEAVPLMEVCREHDMAMITLLAPTTSPHRIVNACAQASGFVYCVSLTGVTGARKELPPGLFPLLKRVRASTDLPIAVGFGITNRKHVEIVGQYADASIVGSALLDVIDSSLEKDVVARAYQFVADLTGASVGQDREEP